MRELIKNQKFNISRGYQLKRSLKGKDTESEINKSIDQKIFRIQHKELSMYRLIAREILIELKSFIRAELESLKNEIQHFTRI